MCLYVKCYHVINIYYVSIMVLFGLNFVNYLVIIKISYQDCGMFNVKKINLLSN